MHDGIGRLAPLRELASKHCKREHCPSVTGLDLNHLTIRLRRLYLITEAIRREVGEYQAQASSLLFFKSRAEQLATARCLLSAVQMAGVRFGIYLAWEPSTSAEIYLVGAGDHPI